MIDRNEEKSDVKTKKKRERRKIENKKADQGIFSTNLKMEKKSKTKPSRHQKH